MAQPNVVPSLFGLTPELYQQNRAQDLQAQQIKAATMAAGPGTMLNPSLAPLYAQAAQRGQFQGEALRGVAGLLGVEDPELVKIRDVQQMRTQFDVSTPAGLRQFAQALGQKGYTDLAIQATAKAADIDKDIATADKARTEKLPNIANLQLYRDRLIQAVGPNDPRVAEVNAEIKGLAEKGTKIIMPGEQQDKELRTARGKKFVELEDRAGVANNTLQVVSDFSGLIDKAFTGAASGAKLTAGQLANTLGVPVTGTTESEQLDQLFAALTLGQAKNLKGALSDKDVRFLKEAVGSRGLTADTLKSVVARIAREAEIDKKAYDKASAYYEGGGDIAKFNFAKTQEEATAEVNEKLAKQKRLNELRKRANQ
jgi:hypothetical protein